MRNKSAARGTRSAHMAGKNTQNDHPPACIYSTLALGPFAYEDIDSGGLPGFRCGRKWPHPGWVTRLQLKTTNHLPQATRTCVNEYAWILAANWFYMRICIFVHRSPTRILKKWPQPLRFVDPPAMEFGIISKIAWLVTWIKFIDGDEYEWRW